MTPRLLERYQKEIHSKLATELGCQNPHQVPTLTKIVVNIGLGEATQNQKLLEKAAEELAASPARRRHRKAKKSIANFKHARGQAIGATVTLRGHRMWEFFDRLVNIACRAYATFAAPPQGLRWSWQLHASVCASRSSFRDRVRQSGQDHGYERHDLHDGRAGRPRAERCSPTWACRSGVRGRDSMTDPISDLLTRIRNAGQARHAELVCPSSKLKLAVAKVLVANGYLDSVAVEAREGKPVLRIRLRYATDGRFLIDGVRRISRPGLRRYVDVRRIPQVRRGLGMAVLSTPRGVLSDREARSRTSAASWSARAVAMSNRKTTGADPVGCDGQLSGGSVSVKGPKGSLAQPVPAGIRVEVAEGQCAWRAPTTAPGCVPCTGSRAPRSRT